MTSWSIQRTEKERREDEVLGKGLETHCLLLHQFGKFPGEAHLPLLIISSNLSSPAFKGGSHPPGCESHSKAVLTLEPPVLWSGALSAWPQALCPPGRCDTGARLLPPPRRELSLCVAAQVASDHSCKNDDEIEFQLREKQDINTSWYTININNISAIISILVRFNKSDSKQAWSSQSPGERRGGPHSWLAAEKSSAFAAGS